MATRMQQRRGTAAQWVSTNSGNGPILNAGEIGYETDTNKFKIGDGTNHWINLDYFIDASSTVNPAFGSNITFEGATANAFETTLQVTDPTADRTITLPDASGTVVLADGSGNVTVSGDLTVSGTTTTINSTTINATTGIVFEGATANAFETTLAVTDPTADRTLTLPDETGTVATQTYVDGAISGAAFDASLAAGVGLEWNAGTDQFDIDSTVTTNDGTQTLTNKTLTSPTVSGLTLSDSGIVIEGSSADAHETTLTVTNPTADRTITFPDETGTVQLRVTDVSDTEIGYLNGVTSAIQTQMDTKAPTNNASFTGTFSAPTGTITSAMIADGTIVNGDIDAAAAIAQSKISGLTTDLGLKAPLASPTFTGTVTVPTPANATDAVTKAYVDAVTEGLHIHASVVAATTANVTLSSALENGDTLDGITLATNDRILVKNQTTTSENGIYVVQASGQPTRATDFDTASEVDSGDFVFVSSGTVNGSTGWVQTNKPATIGTDPIAFTQFSGAGTYVAGTGLTLTGNSFSVNHPVASQSGNSGKYLTTDGTNTSWGTISGYSAPTLGSTSIASGATVSTIAGLTLTAPTLTGTVTASGDINLSAANGPGSLIDELTLLLMGAI
jgi:hypothetical protein